MSKIWYPYSQHHNMKTPLQVRSASGVHLSLDTGEVLLDGISSWWSSIHGYNHPVLNQAMTDQLGELAHVMLGGLTHQAAQDCADTLIQVTPEGLNHVFYSDSGSVGCDIALKMAIQYWRNQGNRDKQRFIALEKGYHGDTFGAMSVGNPDDDCPSMHRLFEGVMPRQFFVRPALGGFHANDDQVSEALDELEACMKAHHQDCAAFICEPILQGAGGFQVYSPAYLRGAKRLCEQYDLLCIFDEVATGFGRTGTLFAANHADVTPDIMILGKALTAGYMGHSATVTTSPVFDAFCDAEFGKALMHGPTFMGNPLACRIAKASIDLFLGQDYLSKIAHIESRLSLQLASFQAPEIKAVRVLGAMAVIEVYDSSVLEGVQDFARQRDIWLRPFDCSLYITPAYVMTDTDLDLLCQCMMDWFKR